MPDIAENIRFIKLQMPQSVKLVAVSKTKPVVDIRAAYDYGQRDFGENRVQELLDKKELLPSDIKWHVIGHLQTNKVKFVVPFVSLIHSVDTFRLLKTINTEASKISKVVDCLLQIHIASEETKFGFSMEELSEMLMMPEYLAFKNVNICGVMGMATFTNEENAVRGEFIYLRKCFDELKQSHFASSPFFREISMGMSGDYMIAVSEGSTIVRIGSMLFGERENNSLHI